MPEHFSSGQSRHQSQIGLNFTIVSACALQALPCRTLRQLSAPRLIQSNNYVPGGISCAADLTAIFRHKISVSGAPSGKRKFPQTALRPGRAGRLCCPARRGCRCPGKVDPLQSPAGASKMLSSPQRTLRWKREPTPFTQQRTYVKIEFLEPREWFLFSTSEGVM